MDAAAGKERPGCLIYGYINANRVPGNFHIGRWCMPFVSAVYPFFFM